MGEGRGALHQVGLGSRPPRAPLRTWLLPNPLLAPSYSLAPFSNLQDRLPHRPISAWLLGSPGGATRIAQGGGGRGDGGGRAGLQRHHSSSSSYCGTGVAPSVPPAQDTPSSCPSAASPSSSQTSSPPPTRSGLGSGGERGGRAERDQKEREGGGRDRGWERRGSWLRAQTPARCLGQALSRSPRSHYLPCCSAGEDDSARARLARPPPPSATDPLSRNVGRGRQRKER